MNRSGEKLPRAIQRPINAFALQQLYPVTKLREIWRAEHDNTAWGEDTAHFKKGIRHAIEHVLQGLQKNHGAKRPVRLRYGLGFDVTFQHRNVELGHAPRELR